MNYRGPYRKLLGNARAAVLAAVEIYNKPLFKYRDECVVILLLNGWELLLKATLSKNGQSIFYPKKRKQPHRTLSWQDALARAERFFPGNVGYLPVRRNLEMLGTYRDKAVHFYNAKGFSTLVYALAQTCIVNFRDYLDSVFGQRLEDEISWQLLPLGIRPPVDVVSYISRTSGNKMTRAVLQFLSELNSAVDELKEAGEDTGRLLTVFKVKLESVKKIGDADVTVGVTKADGMLGPLVVVRTQDPNITHPLRQKDVVDRIGRLHGTPFTSYTFQAVVWKHDLKSNPRYCWKAKEGVLTRYSHDVVPYIKKLSANNVQAALTDYRKHLRKRAKAKKKA